MDRVVDAAGVGGGLEQLGDVPDADGADITEKQLPYRDGAFEAGKACSWPVFGGIAGPCYMIARVVVDAYNDRKV